MNYNLDEQPHWKFDKKWSKKASKFWSEIAQESEREVFITCLSCQEIESITLWAQKIQLNWKKSVSIDGNNSINQGSMRSLKKKFSPKAVYLSKKRI